MLNCDHGQQTDAAWTEAARERIIVWEAAVPVPPNAVVFEGWDEHPTHVLPETDPSTILSLVW